MKSAPQKVAVMGLGEEGRGTLRFLKNSPRFKKAEIWVLDQDPKVKVPAYAKRNVGVGYLENLDKFDIVFRSPGISPEHPTLKKAAQLGTRISSSTNLFLEHAPCKIIGITGSKGKSTTATLLYQILKKDGRDAHLAGNIGNCPLPLLKKLKRNSIVVLELSSFQLQDARFSPDIAIVLDIFPEHLDYHKNLGEYVAAKANIAQHQRTHDLIFYNKHNKFARKIARLGSGKKIALAPNAKDAEMIMEHSKLAGTQTIKNATVAVHVARALGCKKTAVLAALKSFRGLPHRLEFVRTIRTNQPPICVSFYNDSASTNPHTALAAITSVTLPKILIAGGKDKNLSYNVLGKKLKGSKTLQVVLFGENKFKIAKALRKTPVPILMKQDLAGVISAAYDIARSLDAYPEIAVIFSPASASFDMFRSFKERGEKFKKLARELK